MVSKPQLSAWNVCNICIGAFGIQFGFALPQANATRIFQNLGATLESVPLLWLAGPITGLIIQPLVGYYSDRTWTGRSRRRPYFLLGATLAAGTLFALPNATTLWMAVAMLWMLDASLNLTMGPFRAFVADQLPAGQRSSGYLTYMSFASVGAVIGSLLPWAFAHVDVASYAPLGEVSDAVRYAFYVGATFLISAVFWSALRTREYPPEILDQFDEPAEQHPAPGSPVTSRRHGWFWLGLGTLGLFVVFLAHARGALYVLAGSALLYGVFLLVASNLTRENAFTTILHEMDSMTASMRWLALVQFCSWFALFAIFVYTAPAVAKLHFGASGPGTPAYEAGANWAGVLFAVYNLLAALIGLILPYFVRRFGMALTHRINLWVGSAGLLSMYWIRDSDWLLVSMIGLGFAWASIIALPYAMLANNLPARKMGVNFGIFNIFIVIPQLLAVGVMASLLDLCADGDPSAALLIAAAGWFLAGLVVLRVRDSAAATIRPTL